MPFTEKTAIELERELKRLQKHRADIDAMMQALEMLLRIGNLTVAPSEHPKKARVDGHRQIIPQRRLSLRLLVLKAVENTNGTTTEIVQQLTSQEVTVGGRTSLRARIAHELTRLRQRGVIRRRRSGTHTVVTKEPTTARDDQSRTTAIPQEDHSYLVTASDRV